MAKDIENFLVNFIKILVIISLFTPFIISANFYFPFVGPKSLYFMGVVEFMFFLWIFLILNFPKYRPSFNKITFSLGLFLLVIILSGILGIDPSRSFWSKFERMTGILMWLHLFAFFIVISTIFRNNKDWKILFGSSIGVALILSFLAFLEKLGVSSVHFSKRYGATLGNPSYLGSYLIFNAFLCLWFSFRVKKLISKIWFILATIFILFVMYIQDARACYISFLGGTFLLGLLWLCFVPKSKKIKLIGKISLILACLIFILLITLLYIPGSFINKEFIKLATKSRFVNIGIAKKAFFEKPILGFGPENYIIAFSKYFNPCLFLPECGREIWYDKVHNIVFDTLVSTGIIGLMIYFFIFFNLFKTVLKEYIKQKISFESFAILVVIPVSYFVQNLTVFDMVTSLQMFMIILGFGVYVSSNFKEQESPKNLKNWWTSFILLIILIFCFIYFIIQPLRTGAFVINFLRTFPNKEIISKYQSLGKDSLNEFWNRNSKRRLLIYEKINKTSQIGRYQIREFLAQSIQENIERNKDTMPKEIIKNELDFAINQLKQTEKQSPLDYKSLLRLAKLESLYLTFDNTKLLEAKYYGYKLIKIAPYNQQSYWALAQVLTQAKEEQKALEYAKKAIDLEPKWIDSHKIAFNIATIFNNKKEQKEIFDYAFKIAYDMLKNNKISAEKYSLIVTMAYEGFGKDKAKEVILLALKLKPKLEEYFKNKFPDIKF